SCQSGLTNCNGMCVNLQTNFANCGACGHACAAGQLCSSGTCQVSCQAGLTNCSGLCVNTLTDNANCGGCSIACGAGKACVNGACSATCQPGFSVCAGACADLQTDSKNCGACGTSCPAGKVCVSGVCTGVCPTGWDVCSGVCSDLKGDAANCGACGSACPVAAPACVNSVCVSCGSPALFTETFSAGAGAWSLGTEWQVGSATVSSGENYGNPDPSVDHTATSDNRVAGVVIGGNASTASTHGFYYLTSPVVNASGVGPLVLEYWRFLNSDYTPYMQNVVEVWNGSTWVTIWSTGSAPGVADEAWQKVTHDITAYRNASLRVRFGFNIGSSGVWDVSSWNLDDIRIASTPTCN
ncbi:MAG TPA: MXAN_6577-like cysteine-rich protein, partial [Polyangiaceae bacterium]|nr:MXAN_6577-like cysteine-rich protein [Polyangiaceae bacterium]